MTPQLARRWHFLFVMLLALVSVPSSQGQSGFTYYLAEGATGLFFDYDLAIANPNTAWAPVTMTFLKEDGTTVVRSATLPPGSRRTFRVDSIAGLETGGVSVVVNSTDALPLLVERTMLWDATGYAAHTEAALAGPGTKWYFAEGSQGFFDTWLLLANANAAAATATVTFLLESGAPVVRSVALGANSRVNVFAGSIPQLVNQSFSVVVDSNLPISAERAMYFTTARFWEGGHESAGVTALATNWFLAEGATGAYFDTFILVGNPSAVPATATFTFLKADGTTVTKVKTIPATSRLTVNVETEDPSLRDAAVATTVSSDVPVVAERAMYWPGSFTQWFEAHNSFGLTSTATKWGLAEGRVGGRENVQTYILIANPSTTTAQVKVTFLRATGNPIVKTYPVSPTSRFNVAVNQMVPELVNQRFGAIVETTNAVPIAVERALYSDSGGQIWAAGSNATARAWPLAFATVDASLGVSTPPVPALAGVSPTTWPATGGTPLMLSGGNFQAGARVEIGGVDAKIVTVVSGASITVTTPATTAGAADVTVINPDDQRSQPALTPPYTTYQPLMEQVSATGPLYVTGRATVPAAALGAAGSMLREMLANRPDVGAVLRSAGALTAVFGRNETSCDLPYFADLIGTPSCTSGGLGGVPGRPATACAEANVLGYPDDPFRRGRTDGENVCVHELGHTIMNVGLSDTDRAQIGARFDVARTEGKWTGDFALQNADEFFAEMTQTYFCANPEVPTFLHTHGINCASRLQGYDPLTFVLIDGIYRGSVDLR